MENGQEDASLCGLGEAVTAKGDDVITCFETFDHLIR